MLNHNFEIFNTGNFYNFETVNLMSAEHRGAVFVFERTANPLAPLHSLRFPKAENDTFLQNNKDKFNLENDNVENYILFLKKKKKKKTCQF